MLIPNIAKVGVESSNLFARSSRTEGPIRKDRAFLFSGSGLIFCLRPGRREFAKVGVESSNLFARSSRTEGPIHKDRAFLFSGLSLQILAVPAAFDLDAASVQRVADHEIQQACHGDADHQIHHIDHEPPPDRR